MDTLTSSEQGLVTEFVSITNYPGPPHTAIPYLQASDWNLERAIIMYFESSPEANEQLNSSARRVSFPGGFPGDESEVIPQNQRPPSAGRGGNVITEFFESIKAKISQLGRSSTDGYLPISNDSFASTRTFMELSTKNKLVYVLQLLLYIPVYIMHKITLVAFMVLVKLFPIVKRLTGRYFQNRNSARSEPKAVDPAQIARSFINEFNMTYRNDNSIDFYEGGYTSALFVSKRDARFMVVYLHSDHHDDTDSFVRDTLLDDSVVKFFQEHNILVWGGNVIDSEAYQVSNVLSCTKYPFLALLCLKSNTQETPDGPTQGTPTMSVVSRVQGVISPEKLIDKFSSQIERLEPTLVTLRAERQQQALARVVREQQDQAYQTSLARDRAAAEQRRLERELVAKKEQWLNWRATTLKDEVPAENKGEFARVAIRMTDGERVSRRFAKDASIEEIYAFVELYQKGFLGKDVSDAEGPEDFVYPFGFRLVSPMPRAELDPASDTMIKDEPVVWPSGNLFVEVLDDD